MYIYIHMNRPDDPPVVDITYSYDASYGRGALPAHGAEKSIYEYREGSNKVQGVPKSNTEKQASITEFQLCLTRKQLDKTTRKPAKELDPA
jgi:hypothetical protein